MDPTLDAWFNLTCAVIRRAVKDARGGCPMYQCIEARSFLYEPCAEWLIESLGLDVDRMRAKLIRDWANEARLT